MFAIETQTKKKEEIITSDATQNKKLTSGGLDLAKMEALISKSYPKIESAKDKAIILLIGNTGAGKSTTVNYLLKCRLKKVRRFLGEISAVAEENEKVYAEMGHGVDSETFYPATYVSTELVDNKKEFAYCDCPGFMENRGLEEKICVTINTQIAVRLAKSIQSLLVIIDMKSFTTDRGDSLRKLSETLGLLLKDPANVAKSMLFIITKSTDVHLDEVISVIDAFIVSDGNKLKKLQEQENADDSEIKAIKRKLEILSLMKNNEKNIILIDIFDQGRSRDIIEDKLASFNPISKAEFNFTEYQDTQVKFNEVIFKIAQRGIPLIKNKVELPIYINEAEEQIEDALEHIQFYDEKISNINSGKKIDVNEDDISVLLDRKSKNEHLIKEAMEQLDTYVHAIAELKNKHDELNSDEPVLYWSETYSEAGSLQAFIRKTYLGFRSPLQKIFEYNGIPYERVEKVHKKLPNLLTNNLPEKISHVIKQNLGEGTFIDEYSDPDNGKYKVTYISEQLVSLCEASVNIYVYKRNKPDVLATLQNIAVELSKVNFRKYELDKEIERLSKENNVISALIALHYASEKDLKAAHERNLEGLLSGKRLFEEKIKELKPIIIEMKMELEEAEKSVELNRSLFETLSKILLVLGLDILLTNEFLLQYKRLSDNKLSTSITSSNSAEQFICPIGLNVMNDPVQSKCGHSFDRMEIIKYCDMYGEKAQCPCCKSPISKYDLAPNLHLRQLIENWQKNHEPKPPLLAQSFFFSKIPDPDNNNFSAAFKTETNDDLLMIKLQLEIRKTDLQNELDLTEKRKADLQNELSLTEKQYQEVTERILNMQKSSNLLMH